MTAKWICWKRSKLSESKNLNATQSWKRLGRLTAFDGSIFAVHAQLILSAWSYTSIYFCGSYDDRHQRRQSDLGFTFQHLRTEIQNTQKAQTTGWVVFYEKEISFKATARWQVIAHNWYDILTYFQRYPTPNVHVSTVCFHKRTMPLKTMFRVRHMNSW